MCFGLRFQSGSTYWDFKAWGIRNLTITRNQRPSGFSSKNKENLNIPEAPYIPKQNVEIGAYEVFEILMTLRDLNNQIYSFRMLNRCSRSVNQCLLPGKVPSEPRGGGFLPRFWQINQVVFTDHVTFKLPYNQIYQMKTTLILSQLGGGGICPPPHRIFRPSYGPLQYHHSSPSHTKDGNSNAFILQSNVYYA